MFLLQHANMAVMFLLQFANTVSSYSMPAHLQFLSPLSFVQRTPLTKPWGVSTNPLPTMLTSSCTTLQVGPGWIRNNKKICKTSGIHQGLHWYWLICVSLSRAQNSLRHWRTKSVDKSLTHVNKWQSICDLKACLIMSFASVLWY